MADQELVALMILDGWGLRDRQEGNAVTLARTPNYDRWVSQLDMGVLGASGEAVGLPPGQMGYSEVGHMNLGAGLVVYQDITRIDRAIADGSFFRLPALLECLENAREKKAKVHLFGLLGPGGVHSRIDHLFALLELTGRHSIKPILHVITDGRDTPPRSAIAFLAELENFLSEKEAGTIATISGRYYAMDRDQRWDRLEKAYQAYVNGRGRTAPSAREAILQSYAGGITDEFIVPTVIEKSSPEDLRVNSGDCLIFYNFRADRIRQIVQAFALDDFQGFERPGKPAKLDMITRPSTKKGYRCGSCFPRSWCRIPW